MSTICLTSSLTVIDYHENVLSQGKLRPNLSFFWRNLDHSNIANTHQFIPLISVVYGSTLPTLCDVVPHNGSKWPTWFVDLFSQMVISQLLVNKSEWNKAHFVANLIAFKLNTNLNSDYISGVFLGIKNPKCMVFIDTPCTVHNILVDIVQLLRNSTRFNKRTLTFEFNTFQVWQGEVLFRFHWEKV